MNMTKIFYPFAHLFLFLALGLLSVAIIEIALNLFDYTILSRGYTAGRLIELSAALLVFVITVLLRQIRDGSTVQSNP
jgi:hypothetical protein